MTTFERSHVHTFTRLNIQKGKVFAIGAVLIGLVAVISVLAARPSEEVPCFALVPSSGNVGSLSYDGRWLLFVGKRAEADPWQVWEMGVDGSRLRQVTRMAGDCTDPCYLPDGRIAFSGAVPGQPGVRALFTGTRDGSQAKRITFGFYADARPAVLPDGRLLFTRTGEGKVSMLMTVNPDGTGLQRFYGEGQAQGQFALQPSPEARTSRLDGADAVQRLVSEFFPNDPDSLPSRPKPRALTSVVDETKKTGWLLCLDVYRSQLPDVASLKPGDVKQVQVLAVNSDHEERLLGEATVEEDGSFYVEVPADTPLRLRLLGPDGQTVASLTSGIWVRPNENRGCIGCHEDPALSPENRMPVAVMKLPMRLADDEHKK